MLTSNANQIAKAAFRSLTRTIKLHIKIIGARIIAGMPGSATSSLLTVL